MQLLFITSLITRADNFKYILLSFIVLGAMLPSLHLAFFDSNTDKSIIKMLMLITPQIQESIFYENIMYELYMNRTLTFSTINNGFLIETSEIFSQSIFSIILYFFLFILMILMNPRNSGSPKIGWKNIYKLSYWKRLCQKRSIFRVDSVSNCDSPLISVDKINKIYQGTFKTHALNNVCFDVYQGEVIVLIGPNGSGKSTLLNSMTGSIEASSGDLYISGQHMEAGFSEMQSIIGICFQDNVFFPTLTVRDHLEFFGRIRGASDSMLFSQIEKLSSSLDFRSSLDSQASTLSGGQKRKLCI